MRVVQIGGVSFPISTVTLRFFLVTLVLLGVGLYLADRYRRETDQQIKAQQAAQARAQASADSGTDFALQKSELAGTTPVVTRIPVTSKLEGAGPQVEMRRGDSLVLVFRLTRGKAGGGANEEGTLTPMLTVADCTVTAQTAALTKATTQPLEAFVWQWSIDDCKSTGFKAVQLLLACGPHCDDPVADRQLAFIHVSDPFSWNDALPILGVITGSLTVVTFLIGLVDKHRADAIRS